MKHEKQGVAMLDRVGISIRLAVTADVDDVHAILTQATAWLEAQGIRQWPSYTREWVRAAVERQECYVAVDEGEVVGTFRLVWSDPDVWANLSDDDDAGYLHTLAVSRTYTGQGLGRHLLAWAEQYVAQQGKTFLRLDCIVDNERLRRYYEDIDFSPAGQAQAWGRTMQRFQKNVRPDEHIGPQK